MRTVVYSRQGSYLLPDLAVPAEPQIPLGKYGLLRWKYLKENRYGIYLNLLTQGKLNSHLQETQETAQSRMEQAVAEMARAQNVTEGLKAENQLLWVQRMNGIRQAAEEIVMREVVYG